MAYRVLLNLFLKQNSFRVPQILNCFSVLGLSKSFFDSVRRKITICIPTYFNRGLLFCSSNLISVSTLNISSEVNNSDVFVSMTINGNTFWQGDILNYTGYALLAT